ncbi:MAG: hypothetical protein EOO43_11990 [Flavobacterium sp.]|nr:MAG: hypothetical protein EOO43_11990 [Flavobacterium sp.]
MTKFRKPDQHYIDLYDRHTIQLLKEFESKFKLPRGLGKSYETDLLVKEKGIHRARMKAVTIQGWMNDDEFKDSLTTEVSIPSKIKCNACNSIMQFEGHLFEDMRVLFLFKCPRGHLPKKIIYQNGNEQFVPEPTCGDCGDMFKSKAKQNKASRIVVSVCNGCGKVETKEFTLTSKSIGPINENDRERYCCYSPTSQTFMEGLAEIERYMSSVETFERQKVYDVNVVEKLTIPQLELRLCKVIEAKGYSKFGFEKPEFKKFASVKFSVQDPSENTDKQSVKTLLKIIKLELLKTNWRLLAKGINYRLAVLTGELRAFESDNDLQEIAEEIITSTTDIKE